MRKTGLSGKIIFAGKAAHPLLYSFLLTRVLVEEKDKLIGDKLFEHSLFIGSAQSGSAKDTLDLGGEVALRALAPTRDRLDFLTDRSE